MELGRIRGLGLIFAALFAAGEAAGQESVTAAKIYEHAAKSVLLILLKSADGKVIAQGTGFLIENGKIITNEHVIRNGTPVLDLGGIRIPAVVEKSDNVNDLAILTTSAELSAEPLTLAEKTPPPGSSVFAIGNPEGLEKSISSGVLAGVRQMGTRQLLQITTPISHGSSGGPVFDSSGKVIGVTVGSIEEGQNLNFAVPVAAVVKLLTSSPGQADVSSLMETAQSLILKRSGVEWSADANSPYQKLESQIAATFVTAIERAGKDDVELLVRISDQSFSALAGNDVAIEAAEKALRLKPSPEANLSLAKALNSQALFTGNEDEKRALLARSEKAARAAILTAKPPSAEMYYTLGYTLVMREVYADADTTLRRALELNRANRPNAEQQAQILRELINTAEGLKHPVDTDKWFDALVQTGVASAWDWRNQARRLDAARRFNDAGTDWQQAATMSKLWTDWCEAGGSFELVTGAEDSALYDARQCISGGSGKEKSEGRLSDAHRIIAKLLNQRGVYEEALSHAKEATILTPEDATAYDVQAVALLGLRRNQEAINAAKQAIRLSDGKYGIMHFHLGSAYFEIENWQFAKQSYEKAAELMPTSDAAAYNVALCMQRLGYSVDAITWYQEALRRNPSRTDRQQILDLIAALRR